MARKLLPNYIRRSGATFETLEGLLECTYKSDATADRLDKAGIPLTRINDKEYATSNEEFHCFIIGDSGSGKTRRVILPSIHFLSKARESMVISDPKGELYRTTGAALKEKGYDVILLNFRTPKRGNRWNPLALIEKYYRSQNEALKEKSMLQLNEIASVLQAGITDESDPYWASSAASMFRGIALLILEYYPYGSLTFENIALLARELEQYLNSDDSKGHNRLPSSIQISELLKTLPQDSPIANNLSAIITNAPNTRRCILSMFEAMITLYSSQESLLDLFSTSEIEVDSLGKRPTALYFILPDDNSSLYPIATVFIKQIYSALIELADSQSDGRLPTRVTFLLDEFANFTRLPAVESMLTAARSRGIRFVLVCQSLEQLTQKYEETGMETLLSNCRAWVYLSCRNVPFLRRLTELAGTYISPYTGEQIPLLTIDELQQFKDGKVLVIYDRCRPFIGHLNQDYSEIDFGDDLRSAEGTLPPVSAPFKRKKISFAQLRINTDTVN